MAQLPVDVPLRDQLGRELTDLRISVTDRCNFRCGYCMPRSEVRQGYFLPKSEILSFEEIARVARAATELGVKKIRLTGGEPLTRRDLPRLVAMLSETGVELALTTNGVLLPRHAEALRRAGLERVTVSLDALDPTLFQSMTDAPAFGPNDVLAGIEAAVKAGFKNLKVNVVVKRGVNDCEIVPLQKAFSGTDVVVRFIEYMDVGSRNGWSRSEVFTKSEILKALGAEFQPEMRAPRSPSLYFTSSSSGQRVGIIASVTEPFCTDCSRLRLTADGRLFTCLFGTVGLDTRELLRRGDGDDALRERLRQTWLQRADRYSEEREGLLRRRLPLANRVEMSTIGG